MCENTANYNLLEEKWIPVLRTNGTFERVGIRKALTEAGTIRQIAASNPMDNVALLRLLLAVLQWCKPGVEEHEMKQLRSEGAVGIPAPWLKKLGTLEKPNSAFDLLRDTGGFYQDSAATGVKVAVMNLLHDFPSGSKIAHFRHTRDGREGMCLPCCALGTVRWPSVASAGTAGGGESMTASINGNNPAYSVPRGMSLLSTLLFSWPSRYVVEGDKPLWDGAGEKTEFGFLKGLTWRSRRILLAPPNEMGKRDWAPGRCCHCGEEANRLVRSILFRPGWSRPFKGPWPKDPYLLRVTGKAAQGTKNEEIVPSWPSPNRPLEDHARVWRSVLEGHLQQSLDSEIGATEFHTTLCAVSQALYKHVGTHLVALPELGAEVVSRLLNEMDWLTKITWITSAARARNWRDPPRGHFVVGTLHGPVAKGHAIRSGLCAFSPLTECELEKAFLNLACSLARSGDKESIAIETILADWRSDAVEILRNDIQQVIEATTPGSPLRRQEAVQRFGDAVREAVRHIEREEKKAAEKPERARRKGGKA